MKTMQDWKRRKELSENPDLECLSDLLFAIEQHMQSPSLASKSVLVSAISCTKEWLKEKGYEE